MRKINKIIVHCSATIEGKDFDASTIRKWHVDGNGWSDIGYHYVIKLDGTIEEGRPLSRSGAHAKGYNKDSIGICYIGGLDANKKAKDTRTLEQKDSLVDLILELSENFEIKEIYGHNKVSAKACPCFDAEEEYKSFTCYD